MNYKYLLFALLFSLGACTSFSDKKATEPTIIPLTAGDHQLLSQAYLKLLLSVKMAEEAITRSTAWQTKELAAAIVNDHTQMMDKLQEIAADHGAELPMDITASQIKTWQQLVKERGISFDKKFVETMHTVHGQAIALFSSIEKKATDSTLKLAGETFVSTAARHQQLGDGLMDTLNNRPARDSSVYIHAASLNN